jgi:Putative ATP-dependent DNA helicase recG C-terminal
VPGERYGVCENSGPGIGAMIAALRQAGMTPPVFEDRVATFRVTFPNQALLDEPTVTWLNGLVGDLTRSPAPSGLAARPSGGGHADSATQSKVTPSTARVSGGR